MMLQSYTFPLTSPNFLLEYFIHPANRLAFIFRTK